jgi:FkbM family methyltransferase
MQEYHFRITTKTKILNFLRMLFRLPLFENALLALQNSPLKPFVRKLIPPNYLYPKDSFRFATHRGAKFKLDISNTVDHYLYWKLEEDDYNSIVANIQTAKTIFDIGANIGSTALYFAHLNPKCELYAFEPNKHTFSRLNENLQLNNFPNIKPTNLGLGEGRVTLRLYEVNEKNPGMNRIMSADADLPYTNVEIDSMDSFCLEQNITHIDFIKVDVEGYEFNVLNGGKRILAQSKPVIFLELDNSNLLANNHSAKELIALLQSLGYTSLFRAGDSYPISSETDFTNCHYDIVAMA